MEFTIFILVVILFSIIIHEIAHGSMAYYLGDPTAKNAGRLTLNPLKHLDLFGSVILPLLLLISRSPFLVGWAKPVPINPFNFRDRRWDELKVSLAGPSVNLLIAIIFGLAIRFFILPQSIFIAFSTIAFYNFLLAIFNLIPIPPLDGSWILFALLSEKLTNVKLFLNQYGLYILIFFIFFGLNWVFLATVFLYSLITGHSPPSSY